MTRLNQVLAREAAARSAAQAAITRAIADLGNPAINGFTRTYEPRGAVEGRPAETLPDESRRVQVDGEKVLDGLQEVMAALCDVVLTKDEAKMEARGDIVVDGEVLLADVPTSYLLFLEDQLKELGKVIKALPLLDPKEEWRADPVRGLHAADPRKTASKQPVQHVQVLYDATPQHPAQTRPYETQDPVGDWTVVQMSGAFEADRIAELESRSRTLRVAVQCAREEANTMTVTERPNAGAVLAGYLLG